MNRLKELIKRYDLWCESMGLAPDQKRSCVPVKREPSAVSAQKKEIANIEGLKKQDDKTV
ncbi:hypothetical protein [Vibrio sp. SCSIO 43137]|uniref:hypothetical protein n=1 Tax=Vibrio sp. SCSIO 43137 TaxID=3021011 RepID=UPI0023081173|nr:hypothetical protein [Vibrio sp. SCSIO 43137]WCE31283.1 hypothetical protein PK654_12455 [Vibrio sp. SCSIO 43137]